MELKSPILSLFRHAGKDLGFSPNQMSHTVQLLLMRNNYLQVTEEHFRQAAQNAAQYPAALSGREQNVTIEEDMKNRGCSVRCGSVQLSA